MLALVSAAVGCKAKTDAKPPCEAQPAVQALVQVSDIVNVGEGGESWPTTLMVYQLKGITSLDQPLDADAVFNEPEKVFGEEFIDKRELVAYPSTADKLTRDKMTIALKPNTTHLVVAAGFREKIGSAWYASMAVPPNTRDDQCAAVAAGDEPTLPCLYVSLERSELAGGAFAPSGFELSTFETVCAAPSTAKKKPPKKKKKAEMPKVPKVPQTPKTPSTPSTPSAPSTPSMPSKPTAPTAPKLPGR